MLRSDLLEYFVLSDRSRTDYLRETLANLERESLLTKTRIVTVDPKVGEHRKIVCEPAASNPLKSVLRKPEPPRSGDQEGIYLGLGFALRQIQPGCSGVCVLSDDILLRRGFREKLLETIQMIVADGFDSFVLSGYAHFAPEGMAGVRQSELAKGYFRLPLFSFRGSQCLIFFGEARADFRHFLEKNMPLAVREPSGSLINRYQHQGGGLFLSTRRTLVQHRGRASTGTGRFHESPTFDRPWPGREEDRFFLGYRRLADAALENIHQPVFKGRRGIVICAGGTKYFTCAWICVKTLRRLGCRLPIEFWHLGPEEMPPPMRALADRLGVRCVDALALREQFPARRLGGWELKCYAILHSRFREVLLLDADNVPVVNPRFLFDTPEYRTTGAIFWPDIGSLAPDKDIWKITGVPYNPAPDFESGQIVVDKKRCWKALCLAMHYNEHSDFYYQHIYGDKDTFRFAFLKTGTHFSMPSRRIEYIDGTLCQHDFEGRRILQHRIKKWSLSGKNKRTGGFVHEEACLEDLEELRRLWGADLPIADGARPSLIPRILHRLWLGSTPLDARQRRWAASWRKHHPAWKEMVWTEENLPELINRAEFDRTTDPLQRMEIAGYELLHRFGGVLVDADFECLSPLDEILAGEECVIGEESPGRICHGLIASVADHEFLKELVRRLPISMREYDKESEVEQTGANYVTRVLRDRWDVTILPPECFHPIAHGAKMAGRKTRLIAGATEGSRGFARHHCTPRWMPRSEVIYRRRYSRFHPNGKTTRELAAAKALTTGFFEYHRVNHDRRSLEFLPDGSIGQGAGGCEQAWDIVEEREDLILSILGSGYVTCSLRSIDDGCWRGEWLICEKMSVELTRATVTG